MSERRSLSQKLQAAMQQYGLQHAQRRRQEPCGWVPTEAPPDVRALTKERDDARAECEKLRKELEAKPTAHIDAALAWKAKAETFQATANDLSDKCGCLKADLALAMQRVGELTLQLERERKERRR